MILYVKSYWASLVSLYHPENQEVKSQSVRVITLALNLRYEEAYAISRDGALFLCGDFIIIGKNAS